MTLPRFNEFLKNQNNKETIFITGGNGLLGKRIVSRLCKSGYSVRLLSRSNYSVNNSSIQIIRGDILNEKIVEKAMSGCLAVFHCAAELRDLDRMYDVNVHGTNNVYNTALKNKINYFCHISSVGVIGKTKKRIVDEDTPCNPMNQYELTKLEAEQIVEQGIEGCSSVILRPTNIFAEESLNPGCYNSLFKTLKIWLKGRENAHLVYVDDVAAAAVHFLGNPLQSRCEQFIVSSDEEPGNTVSEVYELVRRLLGFNGSRIKYFAPIIFPYLIRFLRHDNTNRGDICYSSSRLSSTGFKMPFGFIEGLRRAVAYDQRRIQKKNENTACNKFI